MNPAGDIRPQDEPLSVDAWLTQLGALLPAGAVDEVGSAERAILLDLARIAAHRSHRTAAPISTYVIGLALASLPRAERLARMRDLASRLDLDEG
jgi:hypothetical protein